MREEKREKRDERREKREERRQDDPGPKFPDWCRAWGVIIFAMYVSRVRMRVRGSYQVFYLAASRAVAGIGQWQGRGQM